VDLLKNKIGGNMHHHNPGTGEFLGGFPIWIIVIGFIVIVVLIGIYFHRKRLQSDYLKSAERKTLDDMEIEILKFIRQTGKPIRQSEICDYIPLEPDEIAAYLSSLQEKKLIERDWRSDEQVYIVKSV
jgi:uncharacterized membrane protein